MAVWLAVSLRDDDSTLRVVSRYIAHRTGLSPDRSVYEVLRTMQRYARRRRYDAAIAAGEDWTNKNPISGSNDQVFLLMASLRLEQAKQKPQLADDYVAQAIRYRDKALPIASDISLGWYSVNALQQMALISEYAGDLSSNQRCVQYRNALKLLDRVLHQLEEKRVEIITANTEYGRPIRRERR